MSKKHDENKDLRSVSRVARVDYHDKSIQCAKSAKLGIHMLGKIDFLTKYCGWHFVWNNSAGVSVIKDDTDNPSNARAQKKQKKEPKLTDKTKKLKRK